MPNYKQITNIFSAYSVVSNTLDPLISRLGANLIAPENQKEFDSQKKEILRLLGLLETFLRKEYAEEKYSSN